MATFTNNSPIYPLRKLETPLHKESIDKIGGTSYQSLIHGPIDEIRNPSEKRMHWSNWKNVLLKLYPCSYWPN